MSEGLVLLVGGVRSGKSRRALELAGTDQPRTFLATAVASDEEMEERIARHRLERDASWTTIEESLRLAEALGHCCEGAVVIDCMTLWLAQAIECGLDVDAELDRTLEVARARRGSTILVSNEVGMGVVPPSESGRRFRDEAGRMNQRLAAIADRVLFIACGLELRLK